MTNLTTNVISAIFGVAATGFFVWLLMLASNFKGF
ncbi:hypothetical protein [Escherichia phage TR3]